MSNPPDRAWDPRRIPHNYRNPDPSAEENLQHEMMDAGSVMHDWYRHLPKHEQESYGPDHIAAYQQMQKNLALDHEAEDK